MGSAGPRDGCHDVSEFLRQEEGRSASATAAATAGSANGVIERESEHGSEGSADHSDLEHGERDGRHH